MMSLLAMLSSYMSLVIVFDVLYLHVFSYYGLHLHVFGDYVVYLCL